MLLRAGTFLNNRYEILSTVGTGGMADVYRARDTVLKRLVAVKVLKEEFSSDAGFVAKFRREAQAVGALNHPNIVGVFDVGEQNGMYYIVMELVEGINLKKYIEKAGAMGEREAVEVAMQVAKGLEAAHEQGIIHRDIKPQNIIISREGKIKVADFGIARMVSTETSTTSSMGSVHYISPEQARGSACDARSDIYSLGITLYEMVTGQVPFDGESSVSVALKHVQEKILPPGELVPDISLNLEKIILKCTQKNPGFRYQTMSDLLVDFRKLIVMPEEDFVILPEEGNTDPSLAMRREDADILKVAGINPHRKTWETEEQAAQIFEEGVSKTVGMQEEDRLAEKKAKRTESILNYVMLGIGVMILAAIIAIVFKGCALLAPPSRTTTAWVPETISTTPRASIPTTEPTMPSMPSRETTTAPTTPEASTVPEGTVLLRNLIGMDYAAAMDALLSDGLKVRLEYETIPEGSEIPENTVVDQSYDPDQYLLLGTEVTIWIAVRSNSTVVIPTSIIGSTAEEAGNLLRKLGLVVTSGTEWENSSTVEKGKVMGTNPPVGSLADKGTPVTLVISNGPAMFKMPAILGYTREQAVWALNEAGFSAATNLVVRPNTIKSDVYLPDTVGLVEVSIGGNVRTVNPGEMLDLNSVVYITLTDTAPVLPALLGREDIEAVEAELQKMGLTVTLKYEVSGDYPVGQICWVTEKDGKTDIPEGKTLKKGDTVMLHISAHAVPKGIVGMTVTEVQELLDAEGIPYKFENDVAPEHPETALVTKVSPKEGKVLTPDMVITISFGAGPEPTEEPTTEEPETEPESSQEPPTEPESSQEPPTEPATEPAETEESSTVTIPSGIPGMALPEALAAMASANPSIPNNLFTWNYILDGVENNEAVEADKTLFKVKNLWASADMSGSPIAFDGAVLTMPSDGSALIVGIECELIEGN